MKQTGYKMKEYGIPTKRYCQTLDLKDDPELISFDFDWDEAFARLATLPRRRSGKRICPSFRLPARATSAEKWRMMERIFHLD